jgi:hypothetical protein
VTEHYYPGGAGRDVSPEKGIDDMLSAKWISHYESIHQKTETPLLKLGLPFRFTEANDHYSGGVKGGSETFAGALWALDYLHWWAAHDASGVDFHNTQWVVNDVITLDSNNEAAPNPKAYGLKAFALGSRGSPQSVRIENPEQINLTAYAVHGASDYFVTLINKEHTAAAREANVTIALSGKMKHAEVIYLVSPDNEVAAKTGVTLGGAPIANNKPWQGKWKPLPLDESDKCVVKVSPASAAIVKMAMP